MKRPFLIKLFILLAFFLSTGLSGRCRAAGEDFEFYKKYGEHSKQWDDAVKQGFDAYDLQKCDEAMTALKQAVASQCQDGLVYYKLAVCSEVSGSPYTALQYYQLAEDKLGKLPAPHHYQTDLYESYGRALFQAKRFDEAFPYLTRAAAVGSPSFGLYYMVGFLYAKKNDVKAAIEFFDKALAQDTSKAPQPILAMIYREVAKSYYKDKNYPKATDLLTKALAINPNDQEAIQMRNELSNISSQQNILQMIQGAEDISGTGKGSSTTPANPSKPPPPAAAKLPPLESQGMKDPTPPLGTIQGPATVPTGTTGTTNPPPSSPSDTSGNPTTLQPLPAPPAK